MGIGKGYFSKGFDALQKFICPYCFDEHPRSNVQFRCINNHCVNVNDVEMTRYRRGDMTKPQTGNICFSAPEKKSFGIPKSAVCPKCNAKTYLYVCPSCHNTLPQSTLIGRNIIISIVGSRSSGKSHFIGVLIKELIERISVKFGGAMEPFGETADIYKQVFGPIFEAEQTISLTQSSEDTTSNGAYVPLIYHLKMGRKNLFANSIESFTFVFFDTAGEDLTKFVTMSNVTKYICKSAGIIFLLDPLQIPFVANHELLNDKILRRAGHVDWRAATRSDEIMSLISKLIRNDKDLKNEKVIDIPVAAVFSKFDVIEPIIRDVEDGSPGSIILNPSPHCDKGIFDDSDQMNVDADVQGLLTHWNATSFINQLKINYSNYSFFTMSSLGLGNNPDDGGKIKKPAPHRIEDALLWIFKENRIISSTGQKGIKWLIIKNKKLSLIILFIALAAVGGAAVHIRSILKRPILRLESATINLEAAAEQVETNAEQFISVANQVVSVANQVVTSNGQVLRACRGYLEADVPQTKNVLARQVVSSDKQSIADKELYKAAVEQYYDIKEKFGSVEKTYKSIDEQYPKNADKLAASDKRASAIHERAMVARKRALIAAESALSASKNAAAAHDKFMSTNKQCEDCLKKIS